jgi:hypothetical protein
MNKTVTRESLTEAGYRTYPAGGREVWQKTFKNAKGEKLYFLEFELLLPSTDRTFASTTFYLTEGSISAPRETRFRVELDVAPTTNLSAVEQFFADNFQNLGCIPDPHNND